MAVALYNKLLSLLKDDLQFYAYIEKNVFKVHTFCDVTPCIEVHCSWYSLSLTPKRKNKLSHNSNKIFNFHSNVEYG
jgi:hypothetical protein